MTVAPWKGADWNGPTGRLVVAGRPAPQEDRVVPISSFTTLRIGSYDHLEVATTPEVAV